MPSAMSSGRDNRIARRYGGLLDPPREKSVGQAAPAALGETIGAAPATMCPLDRTDMTAAFIGGYRCFRNG